MNQRETYIDTCRGFAILLVVIGHVIQFNIPNYSSNILYKLIYSFHMPLFMLISGFVGYLSLCKINIKKKIGSLLIPYLMWYIINTIIMYFTNDNKVLDVYHYLLLAVIKLFLAPDNGLWYLWVLFGIYLLFYISDKISKRYKLYIFVGINVILKILLLKFKIFILGLDPINYFSLYFLIGYFINKYQHKVFKYSYLLMAVSFLLYLVLFILDELSLNSIFYNILGFNSICRIFLGISGSIFFLILFFKFTTILNFNILLFNYLGGYTIQIYSVHYYIVLLESLLIPQFNIYIFIPLLTAITISICLIFQYLVSKSHISSKLLWGK